jgi:hypothetical protein
MTEKRMMNVRFGTISRKLRNNLSPRTSGKSYRFHLSLKSLVMSKMSAHRYSGIVGGRKLPLTETEKFDRYILRLAMEVSKACDDYQMRKNNFTPNGLRGIIDPCHSKSKPKK